MWTRIPESQLVNNPTQKMSQAEKQHCCCHRWGGGQGSDLPTLPRLVRSSTWGGCFPEDRVPEEGPPAHLWPAGSWVHICLPRGRYAGYIREAPSHRGDVHRLHGHRNPVLSSPFCPFNRNAVRVQVHPSLNFLTCKVGITESTSFKAGVRVK